jgi:SOS-response transcriptional repressor LexA
MSEKRDGPAARVFPLRVETLGAPGPDGNGHANEPVGGCTSGESFALMVLGDSMLPEFSEGDVIVIEPDGLAVDGSFVLAWCDDQWIFRELARAGPAAWVLRALDPRYPDIPLADLSAVRGVIIQKSRPGRRRASKRYVA